MRRAAAALAWAVAAWCTFAIPAIGQSPEGIAVDEIADDLGFRHYFIGEGAPVSVNEIEALVGAHPDVYFVALAETVDTGADQLAADLLELVGTGTVVVLSPDEVGAVSSQFDDASLSSALDVMVDQEDSYAVEFDQFAGALPGGRLLLWAKAGSPGWRSSSSAWWVSWVSPWFAAAAGRRRLRPLGWRKPALRSDNKWM